jgi:hypothetical protein
VKAKPTTGPYVLVGGNKNTYHAMRHRLVQYNIECRWWWGTLKDMPRTMPKHAVGALLVTDACNHKMDERLVKMAKQTPIYKISRRWATAQQQIVNIGFSEVAAVEALPVAAVEALPVAAVEALPVADLAVKATPEPAPAPNKPSSPKQGRAALIDWWMEQCPRGMAFKASALANLPSSRFTRQWIGRVMHPDKLKELGMQPFHVEVYAPQGGHARRQTWWGSTPDDVRAAFGAWMPPQVSITAIREPVMHPIDAAKVEAKKAKKAKKAEVEDAIASAVKPPPAAAAAPVVVTPMLSFQAAAQQLLDAMRRQGLRTAYIDAEQGTCKTTRIKVVEEAWLLENG